MRKRILSTLVCLIMAVSLFPTAAFAEEVAEEGPAAQVGGQTYDVLKDAIAAAKPGETITLLRDYTQKDVDTWPRDLTGKTLDLNGKTYKLGHPVWFFGDNGTVKNGTLTTESSGRKQYTMIIGGGESANRFTVDGVNLNNGLSIVKGSNIQLKNLTATTLEADITSAVKLGSGCSATIESGRYTVNGMQTSAVYNNGGTLTINGGEFSASGSSAVAVLTGAMTDNECLPSPTTINNGTFTTKDSAYVLWNWSTLTINGGVFTGSADFLNNYFSDSDTTVNNGYFRGVNYFGSGSGCLNIRGGYYENEPSPSTSGSDAAPYGYTVILSDVPGYPYQVVKKNNAVRACAYPCSYPDVPKDHPMYNAPTTCQTDILEAVAREVAQKLDDETIAALKQQASKSPEFNPQSKDIYLYVIADLRFVPGNLEGNRLSMELTPVYSIWASTRSDAQAFDFNEGADGTPYYDVSNCCKVQAAQELQIDRPATVQIKTLPDDLVSNLLDANGVYIEHLKNGQKYIYQCKLVDSSQQPAPKALYDAADDGSSDSDADYVPTYNNSHYLEFTTYHGFSPFAVTTTAPVATITSGDGVTIGYESLQDAVNAAQNEDEIILHSGAQHELRLSTAKSIKITNKTGSEVTVTFNGTPKTLTDESFEVFSYTRPSASSSGSSSYVVSVPNAENGTVTVSSKNASKGTTVTVTTVPDKGWTLETLTVLDKNGKELNLDIVTLGKKYTFKMPSGSVTVKAKFMEDNTMLNYFVDVNAQDYFYDAVLWAAEKSITSGTDDSHFSPNAPCTRAQIVTFLWRAAGSPVVNYAMTMEDVPADAYYTEAVRWALSEGITSGTTATTFSPDATCTRAQAVTFLYRASSSPAASGGTEFGDVADGAYYANAVKWAATEGVTEGTGSDTFSPDNDCTRAQIVTFLWRAMAK